VDSLVFKTGEALNARGIRGSLVVHRGNLYWRAYFNNASGKRSQKRVHLGLNANAGQLLEAEKRVIDLATAMGPSRVLPAELPWAPAAIKSLETPVTKPRTVQAALEELERDFWLGKVRTSAAQRTWDRLADEIKRLPQQATLTMDLLVAVANRRPAGSRSRLEACKVFKRLAKLVGLGDVEQLDAIRTPYEPGQRSLPTDAQLASLLQNIDASHQYGWMTWALVTYGCRPSEVFSLQPSDDGTARVLTVKRKGKLPIWRTAMALPLIETWGSRSVPWDVTTPAQYDSLEAKRRTAAWGKWLSSRAPGLQLYDIRHSWAIRSIRVAVPTGLAARCMGHDIAVHTRTYHRWLEQADVAAFIAAKRAAAN